MQSLIPEDGGNLIVAGKVFAASEWLFPPSVYRLAV